MFMFKPVWYTCMGNELFFLQILQDMLSAQFSDTSCATDHVFEPPPVATTPQTQPIETHPISEGHVSIGIQVRQGMKNARVQARPRCVSIGQHFLYLSV